MNFYKEINVLNKKDKIYANYSTKELEDYFKENLHFNLPPIAEIMFNELIERSYKLEKLQC